MAKTAKARTPKLKVFCTPVGFHNAYVAAPSQKAALEAWGAESNLFAAGSAEQVTDPELIKEPLASPGVVFKRLRGTHDEHIAALGASAIQKERGRSAAPRARKPETGATARRPKPRPHKPSRERLNQLEDAEEALQTKHRDERQEIDRRQKELDRQRTTLERQQRREAAALEKEIERARQDYDKAMAAWRHWRG